MTINGNVHTRWTLPMMVAVALLAGLPSIALGQPAARELTRGAVPLANPQFAKTDDAARIADRQPIADWRLMRRTAGVSVHAEDGAVLVATGDNTRGDLMSGRHRIAPFHEIEIRVEYEVLHGHPVLLAGVRPFTNRHLVSQAFLPAATAGKTARERIVVHTGLTEGDYAIQLTVTGDGVVRVASVSARVLGPYQRPDKPVLVLDIIGSKPAERKGENRDDPESAGDGNVDDATPRWANIDKLRTVFGFPRIVEVHFSAFTAETIQTVDPALIAISGISASKTESGHTDAMVAAVKAALDSGKPVIGMCGGHQYMARTLGHRQGFSRGEEWGDTGVTIDETDDPLFANIPRSGSLPLSCSHNWMLKRTYGGMVPLAHTSTDKHAICRHPEKPWVSFQSHIERGWAETVPAGYVLWRNLLREWKLVE